MVCKKHTEKFYNKISPSQTLPLEKHLIFIDEIINDRLIKTNEIIIIYVFEKHILQHSIIYTQSYLLITK